MSSISSGPNGFWQRLQSRDGLDWLSGVGSGMGRVSLDICMKSVLPDNMRFGAACYLKNA
ncbi:MAG: hypothetical protein KDA72_10615 [Planctomycetales bacterium]|nr:hypothetical protein [Planctomycetales bacterium]